MSKAISALEFIGKPLGSNLLEASREPFGLGDSVKLPVELLRLFVLSKDSDYRESVRVATTADVALTDLEAGDTIDGIVLVAGDRVLRKDQVAKPENGVFEVQVAGAAIRAADFDDDVEVDKGAIFYVNEGTVNARTAWEVTSDDPHVVDTDDITFQKFLPANQGSGFINILDYGMDNTGDEAAAESNADKLQAAMDAAIQFGKILYAPPGTYILGDTATTNAVTLNFTAEHQSLLFIGAGWGVTTFRAKSGKVAANGRFDKMFSLQLGPATPNDIDQILFKGMTLDKNGTSNGVPPGGAGAFDWEQAHLFGLNYLVGSSTRIAQIEFEDIHIKDKVGAGINFVSSLLTDAVQHGSAHFHNITESDFDPIFGQRGDLEISHRSTDVVFQNCDIVFGQIETMSGFEATRAFPRSALVANCDIDTFQYGGTDTGDDPHFSEVKLVNSTFKDELSLRNVRALVSNCKANLSIAIYAPYLRFEICDILINHVDPLGLNEVQPVNVTNLGDALSYKVNAWFASCSFILDSDDQAATPAGYAIENSIASTDATNTHTHVIDCRFDPRFEHCIDGYANATHTWRGNKFNCRDFAVQIGAFSTFESDVTMSDNDYSGVTGVDKIRIARNNALWKLRADERWDASVQISTVGSTGDAGFSRKPTYVSAATGDLSGTVFQGSMFQYEAASAGGPFMAYCTATTGTGGTWENM